MARACIVGWRPACCCERRLRNDVWDEESVLSTEAALTSVTWTATVGVGAVGTT